MRIPKILKIIHIIFLQRDINRMKLEFIGSVIKGYFDKLHTNYDQLSRKVFPALVKTAKK